MLTATNNTHREFTLNIIPFRLNNTAIYNGVNEFNIKYADSKAITECPILIDLDELASDGIKEILHTFSFSYSITDKGWVYPLYQDMLTIFLGEQRKDMILPDKNLIGSDDFFDIYYAGAFEVNDVDTYGLLLYNKTDEPLYFEFKSLAINDISLPTRSKKKIEPKTYYYYSETELSFDFRFNSFLSNYNKAACIEVDLRCYGDDAKTQLSAIQNKFILDESITIADAEPIGKVFYDENDVIISVSRYIMFGSSDVKMGIDWQVINNSSDSLYLYIQNISVTDIRNKEINPDYQDIHISFSTLPHTSSEVAPVHDSLILPDEGYTISAELVFHDGNFNEIRRETVIFTLDSIQLAYSTGRHIAIT